MSSRPAQAEDTLGAAAEIEFVAATKTYPGQDAPALDQLDLRVPAGEICVLLGPSGGGKTTALTLVNRMVELSGGDITIGGKSIHDSDPITLRRTIGYVIQQTGLFPHMTVGANIGLIPRILGWDRDRARTRALELLEMVGLTPADQYADRYPTQLSGGQQQRVGMVRALAADPPVMLMDEPFGALDPITRAHVQDEFLRLHDNVRKTTLFVTHDVDEAVKMADRIAILREGGTLAQYGTAEEILTRPASDFVAEFVGLDRGIKALSLATLAELPYADPEDRDVTGWPTLAPTTPLRSALSAILVSGSDGVLVAEDGATAENVVTLDALRGFGARHARDEAGR